MFFSVIIPLYNKGDVIERTLKSVLSQSYKDFELIIVDDGSTDNSLDVVQKFLNSEEWSSAGCECHVIKQTNSGASAARNRGAKESKGRFLAMLDGDDVWLPFHLEDLAAIYQLYPIARVMSTAEASVVNGKIKYMYSRRRGISRYNIFNFPYGDYPMCSDTIAIERECFLASGGYDTRFSYYEDRAFYYKLAEYIGDFYVNWRVSALYYHDAVFSANKIQRKYSEFGFLVYAKEMICRGAASARMKCCVARTLDSYMRNEIVRWRWMSYYELIDAFPEIVNIIVKYRIIKPTGLMSEIAIFTIYFIEWTAIHFVSLFFKLLKR